MVNKIHRAECIYTTLMKSPLGALVAGASSDGICLLEFNDPERLEGQLTALKRVFGCPVLPGNLPHLEKLRQELNEYFLGKRQVFTLPLLFPGSQFQLKVWSALQQIPYGKTCSYEEIARQIGTARAARAVGTANGQNRIAIVIPCHRLVNKNGKLGGYGGGLWRKRLLLELEQRFSSS